MTLKKLILNLIVIGVVATVTFLFHFLIITYTSHLGPFNELMYSYIVNIFLACGVIVLIFTLQKKLHHQLGFVFLAASLLKFVFFFILFYPKYNADGVLTRFEFLTFFIPYSICLITETIILSKFFNSLDNLNS